MNRLMFLSEKSMADNELLAVAGIKSLVSPSILNTGMISLLGNGINLFINGMVYESLGKGYLALTFYKTSLEKGRDSLLLSLKNYLLNRGGSQPLLNKIEEAINTKCFETALEAAIEGVPDELCCAGENPLRTICKILNIRINKANGSECLKEAKHLQRVIMELNEKLSSVEAEGGEVTA